MKPLLGQCRHCANLAGQIAELQGAKARIEQLNERATTSLGVNPQSENFGRETAAVIERR